MNRICRTCKQPKELDRVNFRPHSGGRVGFRHECIQCEYTSHIDYARQWKNLPIIMVQSARNRAKRDGVPCTIKASDVDIPESCPVFGIKLEQGTRHNHENSPSLDRIIPENGYVPGNIRVISHLANLIKNKATLEQLKMLVRYLEAA